jgi:hypothetical protein
MEKRETLRLTGGQKLIARDISESLGKLPPQATDLEEAVLGAVMLERGALDSIPYLKAEHFYLETHQEVFNACLQLRSESAPVDMRTVRAQLSKTGKLELVGGAYFIAELTSKVASAANIDFHARVILEHAIKRVLIQEASSIHHQAYESDSDALQLLDQQIERLQFLRDRETRSSGPERIKQLWETLMLTTKPDEVPPLVSIDRCPVVGPMDHTLIVGKKKSRKSLLVVHLLAIFLKSRENLADHVLLFDTEQGKSHVWKARDRIFRMTNQNIPIFYLRGQKPEFRRDFIRETVKNWPISPKIVVIDGIRDLMSNINDADESTEVIVWLEKLIAEFNIGVINILHLNKTDSNPRGHIGTELQNKTIATIEVEYDNKTGHSLVKCESARDESFDTFAFTHGPTGLPELVGVPMGGQFVDQNEQISRLVDVFEGQALKGKELREQMKAHFGLGDNKVKQRIADFIRRGWILKSGTTTSPNCTYKLNAQPGYAPPPVVAPDPQMDLPLATPQHQISDDLPF